jgi:oxygen-independent coproporphyrinogen-3 oxidase
LTLAGQRFATEAPRAPAKWLAQVRKTGNGDLAREALSLDEQFSEFLLMGMRLREGVDTSRFAELQSDFYINKINSLVDIGMVAHDEGTLRLTPQGTPVLNAVLRALLDD